MIPPEPDPDPDPDPDPPTPSSNTVTLGITTSGVESLTTWLANSDQYNGQNIVGSTTILTGSKVISNVPSGSTYYVFCAPENPFGDYRLSFDNGAWQGGTSVTNGQTAAKRFGPFTINKDLSIILSATIPEDD